MKDDRPDLNSAEIKKHKPLELGKIIDYLNDYAPLVEKLSHDDKYPNKQFRKDCEDLLEIKRKCEDPDYIKEHDGDLFLAWSVYKKFKVIIGPFTDKLTERTVKDIKASTKSNDWKEVMRDLGLLNDINKIKVRRIPFRTTPAERKRADDLNRQELQEINNQLQASQWLPDVTFEGIHYQLGKNLEFTVKGTPVYIRDDGMLIVSPIQEQSGKIDENGVPIIKPTQPESFPDYLKKNGINIEGRQTPSTVNEDNKQESKTSAPITNDSGESDQIKIQERHRE